MKITIEKKPNNVGGIFFWFVCDIKTSPYDQNVAEKPEVNSSAPAE